MTEEWLWFVWPVAAMAISAGLGVLLDRLTQDPPPEPPARMVRRGRYTPSNEPMTPERLVQGGGVTRARPSARAIELRGRP